MTNSNRLIVVGQSAGAVGAITVDGTSASVIGNGGIDVGWAGQGTLTEENRAFVTTSNLSVGGTPGGPLGDLANLAAITTGARLLDSGSLFVWQGSTVTVDGAAGSGIDVGTSGTYASGQILIESGHFLGGDGVVAASIANSGLIGALSNTVTQSVTAGTLEIQGAVTGTGAISINNHAVVRLGTNRFRPDRRSILCRPRSGN